MTRTTRLWPILYLVFISSCATVQTVTSPPVQFSPIRDTPIENYNREFAAYCQSGASSNYEEKAVISNFFGDYKKSVDFATLHDNKLLRSDYEVQIPDNQVRVFRDHFERISNDPASKAEDKIKARRMLMLVTPVNYGETFTRPRMADAAEAIIERAGKFQYLLINEAHNSSQHRAFTSSLLKPLWDKGYRYLALEALNPQDSTLMSRRYPLIRSGYYLRDPVFGNMVRAALALGYKLIAYETTRNTSNSTLRDRDQAMNIYSNTLKVNPGAKVIVHAGYSHIAEDGDEGYLPMGAQLKALAGQDILTVDQVRMTERNDSLKLHPYYKYVVNNLHPLEPVMFRTDDNILVDPINLTAVDMQVYHPVTSYQKGRPEWLLKGGSNLYDLPSDFKQYKGFLLQAFKSGESESAVPVDQLVIDDEKALVLKPGKYILKLTDRSGKLTGTADLQINNR